MGPLRKAKPPATLRPDKVHFGSHGATFQGPGRTGTLFSRETPMRRIRLILPLFALSVAGASSARAQGKLAPISLDRGGKEFAEPFTAVAQVVELRDGRLLVVDNGEKELRLVDLTKGTMSIVGRQGGGPAEYRMPGMLLPGAADTASFYDVMQQRILLISPQGTPVRTVPFGTTGDVSGMLSRMQPAGTDAAGHLYGQTMGAKMPTSPSESQSPMPTFADTIEIQTMDLRTGKTTTLAAIRNPTSKLAPKMAMGGGGIKLTMTAPDFSSQDVWTAFPDGRVALLRDGIYQVHFIGAGRAETVGPVIPSVAIPVTAIEKRTLVDSVRKVMDSVMAATRKAMAAATSSSQAKAPGIEAEVLEPPSWPANKPPYSALQSSPDGQLWVTISVPAGTKTAKYDVLNGTGTRLAQVVLAPGERLVGLGRGTVYTVRKDEDDLQYLRQYQLPRMP